MKKYRLHIIFLYLLFIPMISGCASSPPSPLPTEQARITPVEDSALAATAEPKKIAPEQPTTAVAIKEPIPVNETAPPNPKQPREAIIPPIPNPEPENNQSPEQNLHTTLRVGDDEYNVSTETMSTAYDQLAAGSKSGSFTFHAVDYGTLGYLIDEIDGIQNSTKARKYWIYYINGKKAQIGASQYFIHEGDVISWKYEDEE